MVEIASEIRWQDKRFDVPLERILLTEKWGYDAVFTPEGFGAECLIPAGYLAGHIKHMTIGTRILQVTGRAPAKALESFQGLNHLTGGGRIIAGLGSGTPMQCEGLEGKPWGNPVKRMRDYVAILRQGFAGKHLDHQGEYWSAPYRGPGNKGLAPMKNGLEIISDIPIMLAAAHPQMVSLAAEISEELVPPSWAPSCLPHYRPMLEKGFAAAGGSKSMKDFQDLGAARLDCRQRRPQSDAPVQGIYRHLGASAARDHGGARLWWAGRTADGAHRSGQDRAEDARRRKRCARRQILGRRRSTPFPTNISTRVGWSARSRACARRSSRGSTAASPA